MILWHDCYLFSMDGTEAVWHPSSVPLILVLFSSLIIPAAVRHLGVLSGLWYSLSVDGVKMRWYQFFCVFLLFLLFTCHRIVVFHYMPSSPRWYVATLLFSISVFLIFVFLCNMLSMSVIPATSSFVIISFCSFFIYVLKKVVVMFSSMHAKLSVLISTFHQSLLSLCMSLISTFLCQYI